MENRIKQFRAKKGLTLTKLSILSGVSQGHICDIQNGKSMPTIEIAYAISDALGKTVYQVFPRAMP